MLFDSFASGGAEGLAFGWVGGEFCDGFDPFGFVVGEKACFVFEDDFAIGADGAGDGG